MDAAVIDALVSAIVWLVALPFRLMLDAGLPPLVVAGIGVLAVVATVYNLNAHAAEDAETTTGRMIRFSLPSKWRDQLNLWDLPKIATGIGVLGLVLLIVWAMSLNDGSVTTAKPAQANQGTTPATTPPPAVPPQPPATPPGGRAEAPAWTRGLEILDERGGTTFIAGGWYRGTPGDQGWSCSGTGCP